MDDKGKCPVCNQTIGLLRDGTLRRHRGATKVDVETDGMCSGQYSLPSASSCPVDLHPCSRPACQDGCGYIGRWAERPA